MERCWTTELAPQVGQRVRVSGWLHRFRQLSNVSFLILRDAKGTAQIVLDDAALVEEIARLQAESVLTIEGTVVAVPQAPGGIEIHDPTIEVLSAVVAPPLFDLFRPTINAQLSTILDHAAVSLRHPKHRARWKIASALMTGFRASLREMDFTEIQTPKLVASATESGANVFPVDYFGRNAYLAQSPQFYKQMMVGVFERVFEVGPVFRAEPHDTPRHLNEYVSLDVEMGFIQDHTTVMTTLTRVLSAAIQTVKSDARDALALLTISPSDVPAEIPAVRFDEALELISSATGEDVTNEPDLAPAHERWLGEWAREAYGSDYLFVVGYPLAKRPFYTHPDPHRPWSSNGFDLLFRGLELVTGGQRLHRYEDYLRVLAERGMDPEPFAGYLEAFAYGMPPHGGFAIGLERWVARLVGAENVRETTLFPRDLNRLTP